MDCNTSVSLTNMSGHILYVDIFLKEQEFNEHNKSLTAELEEVKELFSKPEVINAIKVSYNTIDP